MLRNFSIIPCVVLLGSIHWSLYGRKRVAAEVQTGIPLQGTIQECTEINRKDLECRRIVFTVSAARSDTLRPIGEVRNHARCLFIEMRKGDAGQ
jgi:hypothetical protein